MGVPLVFIDVDHNIYWFRFTCIVYDFDWSCLSCCAMQIVNAAVIVDPSVKQVIATACDQICCCSISTEQNSLESCSELSFDLSSNGESNRTSLSPNDLHIKVIFLWYRYIISFQSMGSFDFYNLEDATTLLQ